VDKGIDLDCALGEYPGFDSVYRAYRYNNKSGLDSDLDCDAFYASVEELDRPELKYLLPWNLTELDTCQWESVKESLQHPTTKPESTASDPPCPPT
jgi:hypothetical protein